MRSYSGLLVVVEGVNGSGKSSIIDEVVARFEKSKKAVVVYKFPNRKGVFGRHIDRYLKGKLTITSKYDILNMFAANRAAVKESMEKDLADGNIVICDRYVFSAIAYHIPKDVMDSRKIRMYCNIIGYFDKGMPVPDVVYLIEGEHIAKRQCIMEIFHHVGSESQKLKNMIYRVISNYSTRFAVVSNRAGAMNEAVAFIAEDIDAVMF